MEQRSVLYGDEFIYYSRAFRRIDNEKLLIKVHDDGRVVAHASLSVSESAVKAGVSQRAPWIWRQLGKFHYTHEKSAPRQYISGESHFYLGRRHLLKVVVDRETKRRVKLLRGKFQVTTPSAHSEGDVKKLMDDWYRDRAEDVFQRRLEELLPKATWVKSMPKLRLQRMTKQWGSCSTDHVLTLNTHLIKAPRDCIDYVILHELCHVLEHNHSERFYRLLYSIMPDWEARKVYLDQRVYAFLT